MDNIAAEPAGEPLTIDVTLNVTHRVTVKIEGNSTATIEDLKAKALEVYHRDPAAPFATNRRVVDDWPKRFANMTNISVGREEVSIAGIQTRTTP